MPEAATTYQADRPANLAVNTNNRYDQYGHFIGLSGNPNPPPPTPTTTTPQEQFNSAMHQLLVGHMITSEFPEFRAVDPHAVEILVRSAVSSVKCF